MDYSQGLAPFLALCAAGNTTNEPIADALAALAGEGGTLLDIGSGIGDTVLALAARGVAVTALEPDREMYTVLATRVGAAGAATGGRITPLPLAAGCTLPRRYAVVNCGSLLHLLDAADRAALVGWAAAQLDAGGTLVLDVPVDSPARQPREAWTIAERDWGDLRAEHHARLERSPVEGRWITQWTFRLRLRGVRGGERDGATDDHGVVVAECVRRFDWQPLPLGEAERLVEAAGLQVVERHGGPQREPFEPGSSRALWLLARRDAPPRPPLA